MEVVQKYLHPCLAACSPDRLLHSPHLHRLHLCHDSISPEDRYGRIVYQSVVLDSFRSTARIPMRSQINLLVYDDRFLIISIVYTNLLHSNYTPTTVVFPMPRCHPCTMHRSDRRDIRFLSSCPFQSATGM